MNTNLRPQTYGAQLSLDGMRLLLTSTDGVTSVAMSWQHAKFLAMYLCGIVNQWEALAGVIELPLPSEESDQQRSDGPSSVH